MYYLCSFYVSVYSYLGQDVHLVYFVVLKKYKIFYVRRLKN